MPASVRHEALLFGGGERPAPLTLPWQGGEAGSLPRKVPGWVGAALTKPGRARTARWCGSGERDGKEYERNPRYYVSQASTGLNLADLGRERVQTTGASLLVGPTPGRVWMRSPGGHGECPRRNHGEAAGTKWGSSPVERTAVNVGTVSGPHPPIRAAGTNRRGGFTVDRSDRNGAEPP